MSEKTVVIYGITGSIGDSALRILDAFPERFRLIGCSAGRNIQKLNGILRRFHDVKTVCVADDTDTGSVSVGTAGIVTGQDGLMELLSLKPDMVLIALPGKQGWKVTVEAMERNITVALANKESLVIAGTLMGRDITTDRRRMVPVDSEHAALIQLFDSCSDYSRISGVYLTASGGALRHLNTDDLFNAGPAEALDHPVWNMGRKVTVDSATMVNKGIELIEAYWLFPVEPEQLGVLVHPEVAVHAVLEFIDGSSTAQVAASDMAIPAATALAYPDMLPVVDRLDDVKYTWEHSTLCFSSPDYERYPLLRTAQNLLRARDHAGMIAFAIADEIAVEHFLKNGMTIGTLYTVVEHATRRFTGIPCPDSASATEDFIAAIEEYTRSLL